MSEESYETRAVLSFYCLECNNIMRNEQYYMMCDNPHCEICGVKWKIPTFPIVPLEKSEENA